jgi:hypothetical protein
VCLNVEVLLHPDVFVILLLVREMGRGRRKGEGDGSGHTRSALIRCVSYFW